MKILTDKYTANPGSYQTTFEGITMPGSTRTFNIEGPVLNYSPFSNCQTFALARTYKLFNDYLSLKDRIEFLRYAKGFYSKNQVIVDIQIEFTDRFKELFIPKNEFIVYAPYTNGTGTNMVLILADLKNLKTV